MSSAINVCGFVNTGRSAVSAWAASFAQVDLFPNSETRFVRHPGGLAWCLARIEADRGLGPQVAQWLRDLTLGQVDDDFRDLHWHHPAEVAWVNEDGAYAGRALGAPLLDALDDICGVVSDLSAEACRRLGTAVAAQRFLTASHAFTSRLAALVTGGAEGRACLYANVFNAHFAGYARFFQGLDVVIVDRDPRDTFVEHVAAGLSRADDYELFAARFVDQHRHPGMAQERTAEPTLREHGGNRFIHVFFEDFVRRTEYRAALARLLGLDPSGCGEADRRPFVPDRSLANIGLHAAHPEVDWSLSEEHPAIQFYDR